MTYSILARDSESGEFGVAVQSHFFQVGPIVPWARAGVGAVATQSDAEIRYGPLGLELLAAGYSAGRALAGAMGADPKPEVRQVAMVDRDGQVAVHTGAKCIPEAGHHTGTGYSLQANLMHKPTRLGGDGRGLRRHHRTAGRTDDAGPGGGRGGGRRHSRQAVGRHAHCGIMLMASPGLNKHSKWNPLLIEPAELGPKLLSIAQHAPAEEPLKLPGSLLFVRQ